MHTTNTLIIGGGQAGLAVSRCLTAFDRDHLILERGRVAERWRTERWDSLRLLTPNWMTRLPGFRYDGTNPDGFMTAAHVSDFFDRYAASFDAPVREHTTVQRLTHDGTRFVVTSDQGTFVSQNIVIASGWCDRPAVPGAARHLSTQIHQVVPSDYRNPAELPDGGVLIVGASATGVQLADELSASGRDVTIAVGSHSRMPRQYRGMDIFWWLDMIGALDRTIDDVSDVVAARSEPSLQLVGRTDHRTLDLTTLQAAGVRLVGRVQGIDRTRVSLATDVRAVIAAADRRMARVLERIDGAIARTGLTHEVLDAEPIADVATMPVPDSLDLRSHGISTIVWATGYVRPYEWLELPIFDRRGEIAQYRGVTPLRARVRPGSALPASPQLQLHRRGRPRRPVRRRTHRRRPRLARPSRRPAIDQEMNTDMYTTMHHGQPDRHPASTLHSASYDVIVVGGRAAGAATAMLLARCGLRTLLLDRGTIGSDTLSTHALMRGGVLQLSRWGLLDEIVAARTPPIRRTTFTFGDERVVINIKPAHGVDALYAPRRTLLDRTLVHAAIDAGAEVHDRTSVIDLLVRNGRVSGCAPSRPTAGRSSCRRRWSSEPMASTPPSPASWTRPSRASATTPVP